MKISIDGRGINLYKGSGIGTYTENVLKELINLDNKNEYTIFWAGENYSNFKNNNTNIVLTSKKHGMFYESFYYPKYIEDNNIDLHHVPQNGIGLTPSYTTPTIDTIHDLIPYIMPETVGKGYLERFLRDMPLMINRASGILTVSEYSKKDILKFFPNYPSEKIFVTPLAANDNFKPLDKKYCFNYLKYKYKIDFPYFLYIGGFSSRKNVRQLLLSFKDIYPSLKKKYKLVLCGSLRDEGERLKKLSIDLGIQDNVIFTGFVEDFELPIFYNGCDIFIYPSLYEGFGLPPLEAMSCKTAVITSNLSSIPEITKDNAILINPYDAVELSHSILSLANSPSLLEEYKERGYRNSMNFTWGKTAKLTLDAYNSLSL